MLWTFWIHDDMNVSKKGNWLRCKKIEIIFTFLNLFDPSM